MANKYTIKMTPKVADDLDNIYRYISEELFAASSATNILERIEKGIMRLREFPLSAPIKFNACIKKQLIKCYFKKGFNIVL